MPTSVDPPRFIMDPKSRLDYAFNWTRWLVPDEVISQATVIAETGVEVDGDPIIVSGVVTVWLKNGRVGYTPLVTCHIETSDGRKENKSLRLRVQQK